MKEFLEEYGAIIFVAWAMILITLLIGSFVFAIFHGCM